jgi:hypothetical protein
LISGFRLGARNVSPRPNSAANDPGVQHGEVHAERALLGRSAGQRTEQRVVCGEARSHREALHEQHRHGPSGGAHESEPDLRGDQQQHAGHQHPPGAHSVHRRAGQRNGDHSDHARHGQQQPGDRQRNITHSMQVDERQRNDQAGTQRRHRGTEHQATHRRRQPGHARHSHPDSTLATNGLPARPDAWRRRTVVDVATPRTGHPGGTHLACRLALVPREAHEPPVRSAWQLCLDTIDPGPGRAADACNVRRGGMLHD